MDLQSLWPPYAVSVTAGDLELHIVRESDAPELVDLVLAGIHPPDRMPFSVPWTRQDAAVLPAEYLRYLSRTKAETTAARWSLQFGVRVAGELVGIQGLEATDFAITRTAETGSWLGLGHHGRGIGTRMRQAVCAFAFDELDAVEVTSGAFLDNPQSLAVSRKVGYRGDGIQRLAREGGVALNQRLVLTPDTFIRGEPITVTGAEGLRDFLDLDVA